MNRALVDTTVLANILLKDGLIREQARAALETFDEVLVPQYAIKELKAGALSNFVWVHNKLVETGSYADMMAALQRMALSPRRYLTATALEALAYLAASYKKTDLAGLTKKYGETASADKCLYDHARLSLKRKIAKAWRDRRKIADQVVCELPCYTEAELKMETVGLIDRTPVTCNSGYCCLSKQYANSADAETLERSIPAASPRAEDSRRRDALKKLRLGRELAESDCRSLGDAVFALQCPRDAKIVTTNARDHKPLAEALGKEVFVPER